MLCLGIKGNWGNSNNMLDVLKSLKDRFLNVKSNRNAPWESCENVPSVGEWSKCLLKVTPWTVVWTTNVLICTSFIYANFLTARITI